MRLPEASQSYGLLRAVEATDDPEREDDDKGSAYREGGDDVRGVAGERAASAAEDRGKGVQADDGLDPAREQVQRDEHRSEKKRQEERSRTRLDVGCT